NSVKRLMGLVRELLFLDRLELEMNPEEIAIADILTTAVDTVKELSLQSGIEIIVQQDNGRVYADRNRIVQVIVNLLSNAMKFSPASGKVKLEATVNDGFFVCRVSDEGRGIPEEFRKQIFEPFKQVDSKDATTKKGTGLGLTISRSIVEQHGGTIGVDSIEGQGSTFWFKIPTSVGAIKKTVPDKTESAKSISGEKEKRIISRSSGPRKFGVLRQGLVIIAVPLIFQFAFVCVIGYLLTQIGDQIRREQDSKEIISSLNSGVDVLLSTSQSTAFYAMTNSPVFKKAHEASFNKANQLINRGRELLVGDEEELKTLDEAQAALKSSWSMLDAEALKNEKAGFTKIFESTQKQDLMEVLVGISAKTADPRSIDRITSTFSAESGMSTLELMNQLRTRYQELVRLSQPIVDVEITLQKLMLRERAKGEKLSETRSKMIKTLELTLAVGIVLNIGLSIFLAITLMRSLTSRLQHVMSNTEHLVKREPLDAPIPGGDEIASLDQTMYETGLRLAELETFKRELISIVSHE
ncbi:MAG: HAMP domain-containing histidine kinase, partial [Candidatus Obscuribacterales bacterium]|nr:HAMP domain-containing histidine kinase [Candidatus Obscuribacterales bacterium]